MEKKIERYKKAVPEFKTKRLREICCDECIAKNEGYIRKLTGGMPR
jgi:hypothetical protein